jgi:nucleoside-diphosphate-sugar epimerase
MKIVAITGADGFIGHRLTKNLLKQGIEVYAIGINQDKMKDLECDNLHFFKLFFDDYDKIHTIIPFDKVDVFYHFAWNGLYGEYFKDYSMQIDNIKHSCDALMEAIKAKCKKFVFASTINVLETRAYMSLDRFEPRYTNIYAMAKLSSEMMLKTLAYQNKIDFNCGLISMVFGENNVAKTVQNVVLNNLLSNKESNLVSKKAKFDLIYVEDVANAFIIIGEKGFNQKTYYIGHHTISTFGEIFDEIRAIINPKGVLNYGVYKDENNIDYSLIKLDALKEDTGFEPVCDFKESILKTANWLKTTL